jgi:2-polyprenyl-3-methyl-5-hydroxy-6-metoxy-1,4-benzoquinol methylase
MTTFSEIIELNRGQKVSEIDPFTEGRYKQFVCHLPPGAHDVLDVGCNTGRGGVVMKTLRPSLRVTGLDCVPERVQALDPNIYDAKICDFTQSISSPSDSFDAIVAGEFIEHLPPDQVDATLCEFFRLLRLRGLLLLTTPNPRYVRHFLERTSVLGGAHISQHYISSLRRRLAAVGFSAITIRGSGRVSSVLGEHIPLRAVYGSYLALASKW